MLFRFHIFIIAIIYWTKGFCHIGGPWEGGGVGLDGSAGFREDFFSIPIISVYLPANIIE